jgi:hypothetical protein
VCVLFVYYYRAYYRAKHTLSHHDSRSNIIFTSYLFAASGTFLIYFYILNIVWLPLVLSRALQQKRIPVQARWPSLD